MTLSLDESIAPAAPERELDLVALDDALEALAKLDERQSRMVELRFFEDCRSKRLRKCWACRRPR